MKRGAPARRTALRTKPKPPRSEAEKALALAWKLAVCKGQTCAVCGTRRGIQGHHVTDQQFIEREFPDGHDGRSLQEILWDPANGMPLCEPCHDRHTRAFLRVPRKLLLARHWEFARWLGDKAVLRLENQYPVVPA